MTVDSAELLNTSPHAKQNSHAQEVVNAAQEHLRELLRQRAELTKRIETVKKVLVGLVSMFRVELPDGELTNCSEDKPALVVEG